MATPRASLAVLLTLCAWPVPAGAEAPRRAARLEITATPPLLRLREGGSALIRFTTGGEPPIISANVGRLEGLRSLSGGLFEADYIPPAQIEPQVALITVFTSRGFGWLALPLVGARELAVPSTFVVIDRSRLEASAAGAVVVRTIALSERSRPIPGARPRLEATEGTLSPPVELEPGVFEASWDLPPGPARQARVTAHFAKAPPVSVTLERVAGPPRAVVVEVDRSTVEAGDPNDLEVTGRVVDAAGNPADVAARLVVIVGTGAAARYLPEAVVSWQAKDAVYSGRVKIPARRDGDVLELRVIAAGGLEGSRIVAFVPGAPAAIRVEPGRELLADGRSRPLRVWFVDRNGNLADAPAPPHLSAARGSMGAPARRAPGVYEVDYRSLLAADDYSDAVTARAGSVEGRASLPVHARGSALVIGPRAGFVLGSGGLASPMAGAELADWTRALRASFGLALDVQWFTFSRDDDVPAGGHTLRIHGEATFIAIDGSLGWRRPLWSGMAWLAAGGGAVHSSSTVSTAGQPDLTGSAWAPAAHGSVAWGKPWGPGIPYAELRLGWQGDAGQGPVRGSMEFLMLAVGYRFDVL